MVPAEPLSRLGSCPRTSPRSSTDIVRVALLSRADGADAGAADAEAHDGSGRRPPAALVKAEQGTDRSASASDGPPTPRPRRSFAWGLLAIVVLALVVRLVFALTAGEAQPVKGDAVAFRDLAAHVADGDGYVSASVGSDQLRPSATHPPAFPMVLAALDLVGARSTAAHRLALAPCGSRPSRRSPCWLRSAW